jgi:hypothetical protein
MEKSSSLVELLLKVSRTYTKIEIIRLCLILMLLIIKYLTFLNKYKTWKILNKNIDTRMKYMPITVFTPLYT